MLFTIYLPRLAGPCQCRLAGGSRAAAELPCPGHSRRDTDGDRTPRADRAAGTGAGGHELTQQPRLRTLQAPPPSQSPSLLCLPRCRRLLLCSLPRASPVGTNQPFYATSRRSIPRTGPGASAARAASRRGARPAPPLPTSGRELPWPHHPVPVPDTFGVQPGTPWGRTRVPPHRLPAPSSSLHRLPPAALVPVCSQRAGMAAARRLDASRGCPCHGPRCWGMVARHPHPHAGKEHRPGHAGTPPARTPRFRLCPQCRCLSAAAPRPLAGQARSTAPLPLSIL